MTTDKKISKPLDATKHYANMTRKVQLLALTNLIFCAKMNLLHHHINLPLFMPHFWTNVGLRLPFSSFEKELLTVLNVSPAQLDPNSCAFV